LNALAPEQVFEMAPSMWPEPLAAVALAPAALVRAVLARTQGQT